MSAVAMQSFGFGDQLVRAFERDDFIWFVANDVCAALGIANPRNVVARVDDDERDDVRIMDAIGREQLTTIISESAVYVLICSSRKAAAKQFRRWMTHEALPTIRRTGRYEVGNDNEEARPRVLDLEGALGTADDRHAIKTALLTINTYKDLYGLQAGREMLEKLGFPVPGIAMSPVSGGADVHRASGEGDLHAWSRAAGLKASKREATHLSELYASYTEWCGRNGHWVMHAKKFRDAMVMLFNHEEHPEMIRVVVTR